LTGSALILPAEDSLPRDVTLGKLHWCHRNIERMLTGGECID